MEKIRMNMTVLFFTIFFLTSLAPDVYAQSRIHFPDKDAITATESDLAELQSLYDQFEAALASGDVDAIMGFYADDYAYRTVDKKQIRNMWLDILHDYENLSSIHIFSKVEVKGDEAHLDCTGTLSGISKDDKRPKTIDRWVLQDHFLTKKGGSWKMIGGASHQTGGPGLMPGGGFGFQMDFHPLF